MSAYNFEARRHRRRCSRSFEAYASASAKRSSGTSFRIPAYDAVLQVHRTPSIVLDARHAVSVTERQRYILRVRAMARTVAEVYYDEARGDGLSDAPPEPGHAGLGHGRAGASP